MEHPSEEQDPVATRVRHRVLGFLCLLSLVLYLDRVCIAQAAPDIIKDLHLTDSQMGLVFGAFTLAYGLFEVPTGWLGDRWGSRGVLTRIVLWWSAFTALTGLAMGFLSMLVVRFLFGAGEAGALPNAARVIVRWFPPQERGWAQGLVVTSSQIGGAVAPTLAALAIAPWRLDWRGASIHWHLGWRGAFLVFGAVGVAWAATFYTWYRDNPRTHPRTNDAERQIIGGGRGIEASSPGGPSRSTDPDDSAPTIPPLPWDRVLHNGGIWAMAGIMCCGSFAYYLYITWLPTYLIRARAIGPVRAGQLTTCVLVAGALGSAVGGYVNGWLVRHTADRRWSRSGPGAVCMAASGAAMSLSTCLSSPVAAVSLLGLGCFCQMAQLACWWAVVGEIGGCYVATLFGLLNSCGVPGAIAGPVLIGRLVQRRTSLGITGRPAWEPTFHILAAALLLAALLWLRVDATEQVLPGEDERG